MMMRLPIQLDGVKRTPLEATMTAVVGVEAVGGVDSAGQRVAVLPEYQRDRECPEVLGEGKEVAVAAAFVPCYGVL